MVSASATNVDLPDTRCPASTVVPPPRPRRRRPGQGRHRLRHQEADRQAKRSAYIHDNTDYGKGLSDGVRQAARRRRASRPSSPTPSTRRPPDYSAVVNKVQAANADLIFYGGYYSEAGRLKKQLTDGRVNAKFVSGDGSLDAGFIAALGRRRRRGRPAHLPLQAGHRPTPPGKLGEFAKTYKAEIEQGPRHVLHRGLRRGQHPDQGHRGRQRRPGPQLLDYVENLGSYEGVGKTIEFEANGNVKARRRLRLRGQGRQDHRARHDRQHCVQLARHRPSRAPRRPLAPGARHRRLLLLPAGPVLAADGRRPDARVDLRPDRPRLHAGLRRAAAHQLRPLRGLHDRDLRQPVRHARPRHRRPATRPRRAWPWSSPWWS